MEELHRCLQALTHTHYEAQGKLCVHTWHVGSMACTEVSLTEWKPCHFKFTHGSQEDGEYKQRDRDNRVKEPKHGLPWKWEISRVQHPGIWEWVQETSDGIKERQKQKAGR